MRGFTKFTFTVKNEHQRRKLIKFLNENNIVDDSLAIVNKKFLPTPNYPEFITGADLLQVEFRTHVKDANEIHDKIVKLLGKGLELGVSEPIRQIRKINRTILNKETLI